MESNVTDKKLLDLLRQSNRHQVSLYLPTHQNGTEVRQDVTEFKNCLNRVVDQLISRGMRPGEARSFIGQAAHLLEDSSFWHHLAKGLVLFISQNHFEMMRLPLDFEELVVTGSRFYVKPLLRLFNESERFYLLALSANSCRFYLGTRDALTKILVKGMPDSMDEVLRYDDSEPQLQFHTGSIPHTGDRPAVYHEQGEGKDDSLNNTRRYLRQVVHALQDLLGSTSTPILFAGVDSLFSIFRGIARSLPLLGHHISGNPDALKPYKLHQRGWPLVERHALQRSHRAFGRYQEYEGTNIASSDLRVILGRAFQGRVETLFIASHAQVWGKYTPEHDQVVVHDERRNGDEDLIDAAAVYTLFRGGSVYMLDEHGRIRGPAAALFRH